MLAYALQRSAASLGVVFVAIALLFSLINLVPGDAASVALGPRATPEMRADYARRMGLDQPLPVQFTRYFSAAVRGDLGEDVYTHEPVIRIVARTLPNTLILAAAGLGWAILLGVPLGCISAIKRNHWLDRVVAVLSVSAIAIPSFVVALYALLLFALQLRWLPVIGAGAAGDPLDQLRHLILPSFAIGLGWIGYIARLVRASMLEVLGEPHIRTARAYGVPKWRIVFVYALRIAILPTVAVLGVGIGQLLSGAVFAEIIFARPGLGKLMYDAVNARNYPVVSGVLLVTTVLFVVATLISDLLAATLDPRARHAL